MRNRRLAGRVLAVLAVLLAVSFSGIVLNAPGAKADHNTVQWNVSATVTATTGVNEAYPVVLSDHQGSIYVFYISPSSGVQANLSMAKYRVTPLGQLGSPVRRTVNPVLGSVEQSWPIT